MTGRHQWHGRPQDFPSGQGRVATSHKVETLFNISRAVKGGISSGIILLYKLPLQPVLLSLGRGLDLKARIFGLCICLEEAQVLGLAVLVLGLVSWPH